MNSPIREMKVKSELESFVDLNNDIKSNQEVNNNSTTALNNNTSANTALINNVQQQQQQINTSSSSSSINDQTIGNISTSLSNTNPNLSNNNSTNSHSSSSNSSNQNYTFEYWSQLMKDSKQLQTFSNLFMHVERLLAEGNFDFITVIILDH